MAHSEFLVAMIKEHVGWIAEVSVLAGEFEMEALAAGALRVARGEEQAKTYTGASSWQGFDHLKKKY
jgi:butyrate kinase